VDEIKQTSDQATLAAKLSRVAAGVGWIPKRGYNQHHKYHFASETDVADTIRDLLTKEGVMMVQSLDSYTQDGDRTAVWVTVSFVDCDTGFVIESRWAGEAQDKQDKGLAKALTACTKTFLLKTFLIPTGDDPDAHPGESAPQAANQPAPQPGPDVKAIAGYVREAFPTKQAGDEFMALCKANSLEWFAVASEAHKRGLKAATDIMALASQMAIKEGA
jgi:hypothetical protein